MAHPYPPLLRFRHLCTAALVALLTIAIEPGILSAQWSAQLVIPPRPSPFISRWRTPPGQGQYLLTYTGSTPQQVRYRFRLDREGTRVADGTSRESTIPANAGSRVLTTPEAIDWGNVHYDNALTTTTRATGRFPEGRYRLCIATIDRSNAVLAEACADFTIAALDQPRLTLPRDGDTSTTPNPTFSWIWVGSPLDGGSIRFQLTVVEVGPGKSPVDALRFGRPILQKITSDRIFNYGPTELPLEIGKNYAWQVALVDERGRPLEDREAFSEVRTFSLSRRFGRTGGGEISSGSDNGSRGADSTARIRTTTGGRIATGVPRLKLTGRVEWAYRRKEGSGIATEERNGVAVANARLTGRTTRTPITTLQQLAASAESKRAPLTDANVKVYLQSGVERKLLGTTRTRNDGSWSLEMLHPDLASPAFSAARSVEIVVDDPDVFFLPGAVSLGEASLDGALDLGTTLGLARSFDLNVRARDAATGKQIGNFTYDVFVPATGLANRSGGPRATRSNGEEREVNGVPMTRLGGAKGGGLEHLAASRGGGDRFYVVVGAKGYRSTTAWITVDDLLGGASKEKGGLSLGDIGIEVDMAGTLSGVKGRVVSKTTQQPLKGVTVVLTRPGQKVKKGGVVQVTKLPQYLTAVTGSGGYFTIARDSSEFDPEPYTLRVLGTDYSQKIDGHVFRDSGIVERDPILVSPELVTVVGRVLNDLGTPVGGASVTVSGGAEHTATTDPDGRFVTKGSYGCMEVRVRKSGFDPLDVPVCFDSPDGGSADYTYTDMDAIEAATEAKGKTLVTRKPWQTKGNAIRDMLWNPWDGLTREKDLGASGNPADGAMGKGLISWMETINDMPSMRKGAGPYDPAAAGYGSWSGGMGGAGWKREMAWNGSTQSIDMGGYGAMFGALYGSDAAAGAFGGEGLKGTVKSFGKGGDGDLSEGETTDAGAVFDVGDLTLSRAVSLRVIVKRYPEGTPLKNAKVIFRRKSGDTTVMTDPTGAAVVRKLLAGAIPVQVYGPANTNYAPHAQTIIIALDKDTTSFSIMLRPAGTVTGKVTESGSGAPVEGARVRSTSNELVETLTTSSGEYTLAGVVAPVNSSDGTVKLEAWKTGYVTAKGAVKVAAGGTSTLDFSIIKPNINLTTIYGFPVEITSFVEGSPATVSGAFVHLPSNSRFDVDSGARLQFANVKVTEQNGTAVPVAGSIAPISTSLPLVAFDWLAVKMKEVKVGPRSGDPKKGEISGSGTIDYLSTFPSGQGPWSWATAPSHALRTGASSTIPVITSDGASAIGTSLSIADAAAASLKLWTISMNLGLQGSTVDAQGLHYKGSVTLSGLPFLDKATLAMKELRVDPDGGIGAATLGFSPAPSLNVAGWGFTLTSGSIAESGFTFGGTLKLNIPGSKTGTLDFSSLSIGADGGFGGGSITLPKGGLDVFGITTFRNDGALGFAKSGSGAYQIGGGTKFTLPKYIPGDLTVNSFSLATDGAFSAAVDLNLGPWSFLDIVNLEVNGGSFSSSTKSIDINGSFGFDIPLVEASVGGIHYKPNGGFSIDKLGLGFEMPGVFKAASDLFFYDQPGKSGFEGKGTLDIVGVLGFSIEKLRYMKDASSGGVDFALAVSTTSLPPIPIGPVSIKPKGFSFSLNTGTDEWTVGLKASGSILQANDLLGLDMDLLFGNSDGIFVKGNGAMTLLGLPAGGSTAAFDLNFSKKRGTVTVKSGGSYSVLPDLPIGSGTEFALTVDGVKGYALATFTSWATLAGLFEQNSQIAVGWNAPIDLAVHKAATNSTLYGVSVSSESKITFGPKSFGVPYVADVKVWYDTWTGSGATVSIDPNNASNRTFAAYIDGGFDIGAEACFIGLLCVGGGAKAEGRASGGLQNGTWSMNAAMKGSLNIWGGECEPSCNDLCACWCIPPGGGKICVSAGVRVNWTEGSAPSLSIDWPW